jgi:hypothetical protein
MEHMTKLALITSKEGHHSITHNTMHMSIERVYCFYCTSNKIPKLNELGVDENLGIRIGIDYGAHDQVIWGKYGYMESQEVTATSFFVDRETSSLFFIFVLTAS